MTTTDRYLRYYRAAPVPRPAGSRQIVGYSPKLVIKNSNLVIINPANIGKINGSFYKPSQ